MFFWPILVLIYILWGMSFRYYLGRTPYFEVKSLFNSLIPSTKIVVLTVVIGLLLVVLPFIPLFVTSSPEFSEQYLKFLQGDFEEHDLLLMVADVVFILLSPTIAYRPFLAWISALSGRSGSLRLAWGKTRGNYLEFLTIAVLTNLSIGLSRSIILNLGGNDYITMFFVAPIVVLFNVFSAKTYDFFFLDKE